MAVGDGRRTVRAVPTVRGARRDGARHQTYELRVRGQAVPPRSLRRDLRRAWWRSPTTTTNVSAAFPRRARVHGSRGACKCHACSTIRAPASPSCTGCVTTRPRPCGDRSPTISTTFAKTHPQLVVDTAAAWLREPRTDRRMVTHALRTLVKRGDPGALGVLGFATEPLVVVERFDVSPAVVEMGGHVELGAELRSVATERQRLVVDFVVHHVNASGATSPKVFKWTTVELGPDARCALTKRHVIQQASSTDVPCRLTSRRAPGRRPGRRNSSIRRARVTRHEAVSVAT